jgi:hypothetical protein
VLFAISVFVCDETLTYKKKQERRTTTTTSFYYLKFLVFICVCVEDRRWL